MVNIDTVIDFSLRAAGCLLVRGMQCLLSSANYFKLQATTQVVAASIYLYRTFNDFVKKLL